MADAFDIKILGALQRDDHRTADELAAEVALSPSALARRLRRLRATGLVDRTIALLTPHLGRHRLRALVHIQLREHEAGRGLDALRQAMDSADEVQWCAEISGDFDLVALVDCRDMHEFNRFADAELAAHPAIQRYETRFVKRELKFRPFVTLDERDVPLLDRLEAGGH